MLSFPAQSWDKALKPANHGKAPRNSGPGRAASQITPRLYLSDYWTAHDAAKLSKHGITHVISVIETTPHLPDTIPKERRMHVAIADETSANILDHLDATTAFITKVLEENETNKVLVHCMQGISRSATVVCAYLVATTDMTAKASIVHVQSIRGIIDPNNGFRKQLEKYAVQYAKLKPPPPQTAMSEVFKLSGGLAARIRRLTESSGNRS